MSERMAAGGPSLFAVFGALLLGGWAFYASLAGLSYLVFFRWGRRRFHPDYRPDAVENKKAIRWAMISLAGNAVLTAPIHLAILRGHTKVYFDAAERGWAWLAASVLLYLVVTETLIYWIHRALHHPLLFRRLHAKHHEFRLPTPLVSVAFHPLDSFLQALPHHLCIFLFPVHLGVYGAFLGFVTVWAVLIHDRLTWVPFGLVNYTGHHTAHHLHVRCNYGQFFTLWDRAAGTYRSPADLPASANPVLWGAKPG
jgi:lathosterol oxidase